MSITNLIIPTDTNGATSVPHPISLSHIHTSITYVCAKYFNGDLFLSLRCKITFHWTADLLRRVSLARCVKVEIAHVYLYP